MKLRAAKKHLRKGKVTIETRRAVLRFLKHAANSGKTSGSIVFAKYLYEMISKKYIDIKDINPIGVINISHKNWNLAKVGNYLPWKSDPTPIPEAIIRMSFQEY